MNHFKKLHKKEKAKYIARIALYPLMLLFSQLGKVCKLFGTGRRKITASILCAAMVFTILHAMPMTAFAAATPLTFTAGADGSTVTLGYLTGENVGYKKNGDEWTTYTKGTAITLANAGDTVSFRGTDVVTGYGEHFTMTGTIAASGDVTSLTNQIGGDATLPERCYRNMFADCESLTQAPALPSTTLADYCYSSMFTGCTGLTAAPALPATTLANYCYTDMFADCESLTAAPALPSTTLAGHCYEKMFRGCTSLTAAPALPATTLANYCYTDMFKNCSGLTAAPELPADTLAEDCYSYMFAGCTGLTAPPELSATVMAKYCYNSMFYFCTSLTVPPALLATALAENCYDNMFYGCTSLKISETQTGAYTKAWRIPTTGSISTTPNNWNIEMLDRTGGTFTGDPAENKTYYVYEDLAAPVISGIEDGKTYCETAEFTVTDADLATVTAKGADLTAVNGTYTLTEVGTYDVVATDVAGNSTTVTVTLNANHTYDDACDADCNVCNETRTPQHSWNTEWSSDGTHHWHECSLCGEKKDNAAHTWDSGVITQAPTVTEKGVKNYTCTVCGETKTEEIDKFAPSITEGNNRSHQKGSKDGLTFTSNASLADFVSVSVDGKVIDGKNYTLIEGSIIVTLTADYLDTLSVGKHTLAISSIYGTASTEFTITAKAVDPVIPATGDTGNVFMWSALLFVSCGALSALGISMKCKRANSK